MDTRVAVNQPAEDSRARPWSGSDGKIQLPPSTQARRQQPRGSRCLERIMRREKRAPKDPDLATSISKMPAPDLKARACFHAPRAGQLAGLGGRPRPRSASTCKSASSRSVSDPLILGSRAAFRISGQQVHRDERPARTG